MCKELSEMTLEELWELFPIILKEHDSNYFDWYEIEKHNLLECIDKSDIKRMSHIGSSAVKGLISKSTVDILLEIDSQTNIEHLKNKLIDDGWILMLSRKEPYFTLVFNKGYTNKGYAEKVYHLHVKYYGNWNELYFKDYLIDHKDVADEYEKLKLRLLEEYKHNRDKYTHAKYDFVMRYSEKAKEEYGDKYQPSI